MDKVNGSGYVENGHTINTSLLSWLDLRVFYVRVSKCEIDDSTPQCLTLNFIPLDRHTLLQANCTSALLRRDRLDKKSEEITFVCTNSVRTNGSVKFEVFDREVLVLSGVLELCDGNNGYIGDLKNHGRRWRMDFDSDRVNGNGFLKGRQCSSGFEMILPSIEVYVAGCFSGSPIILTKTLKLSFWKKQSTLGTLESIPENDSSERHKHVPSCLSFEATDYPNYKYENEDYDNLYSGMEYFEGEDGELSWFNSGVRVGVGIGLGICLGIGIGVGLLVKTYQGTTRNFTRRLL